MQDRSKKLLPRFVTTRSFVPRRLPNSVFASPKLLTCCAFLLQIALSISSTFAQCNFTSATLTDSWTCSSSNSTVQLRICDENYSPTPGIVYKLVDNSNSNTFFYGTEETPGGACEFQVIWTEIPNGTYNLYFDQTSCSGWTVLVDRPAPSSITITSSVPPFICYDQPITLTAHGGSDYHWTSTAGDSEYATSFAFTPTENTRYTVVGTVSGCSGVTDDAFIDVEVGSIDELPVAGALDVTICSAGTTSIEMSSDIPGSLFEWTVAHNNVSGPTSPGTGSPISQTLTATSGVTGTATYTIIPTSPAGCDGYPIEVVAYVRVNPTNPSLPSGENCDFDILTLSGNPTGSIVDFIWFDNEDNLLGQGLTQEVSVRPSGNYTYQYKSVDEFGCISETKSSVSVNVVSSCDTKLNRIETSSFTFDPNNPGTPLAVSKSMSYFDGTGRPLQSQAKSLNANQVLVSQTLMDEFGREVVAIMGTPVNATNFQYRHWFVTDANGNLYDHTRFDQPVGESPGTLGWYYSSANTLEEHVPETDFPYSRTEFYEDGTGEIRKSAGPGEHHRLGSGQEILSGTFPIFSEVDDYLAKRLVAIPGITHDEELIPKGVQTVARDQNGRYSVSISDKSGKVVMTARQIGDEELSDGALIISNSVEAGSGNPIVYFYLLQPYEVVISGSGTYSIEDLVTGLPLTPSGEWPVGFYRLIVSNGDITVAYENKLMDVARLFYDDAGRLKVSLSPNGYAQLPASDGKMYEEDAPEPPGVDPVIDVTSPVIDLTSYQYNHQGWLLSMSEPDAGKTAYKYRRDGKIRFSQHALQRSNEVSANNLGKFSYTLYDRVGRPTESGEYRGTLYTFSSLSTQLEYADQVVFSSTDTKDWVKTHYDNPVSPASPIPNLPTELSQEFVRAAVSWTENINISTWYSYDEMGRVVWMAQKPAALNRTFITQYKYDFIGNVVEVMNASYVAGALASPFYHHYEFDADNRLSKVFTSVDGAAKKLRATYEYYLHGPLKRIELGENIQGIDFIYNIHGWLKQINDPEGGEADPGKDGEPGDNSNFRPDVFGMILDYYESELPGLLQTSSARPHNIHKLPFAGSKSLASHSPLMRIADDQNGSTDFREYSAENPAYREMINKLKQDNQK